MPVLGVNGIGENGNSRAASVDVVLGGVVVDIVIDAGLFFGLTRLTKVLAVWPDEADTADAPEAEHGIVFSLSDTLADDEGGWVSGAFNLPANLDGASMTGYIAPRPSR